MIAHNFESPFVMSFMIIIYSICIDTCNLQVFLLGHEEYLILQSKERSLTLIAMRKAVPSLCQFKCFFKAF